MAKHYPLLSAIQTPSDVRSLTDKQLTELAKDVRQAIIDNVSQTGGHFSSNLGTVELTVAMFASYNLPEDKLVWDTGHQAYAHKMLTGRLDRFDTLRKHKGMSGFLKRDESEYDVFGAGHAGTAISAALGLAAARDLSRGEGRVVAITGDAAIASGMSWEALNHAGEMGADITVVLNDNRMSIAANVGALKNHLAKLRSRPMLQDLAKMAKSAIEKTPDPVRRVAAGLRHGITHYLAPEEIGSIFEEMGFEYIGPVDGHDLPTLLEVFRNVRELRGPVFVHAMTVKGKGYERAEEDSRKWHGVSPFDSATHELAKAPGPITYTQTFGDELTEIADQDPNVVAITAAMPDGTGLTGFSKKHPDRYYDVGIAEQHAVTFAAGLAAGGKKPFCAIYSTFLQRGFDQVLHDVCLQHLPVRFAMDRAGLVGDDGPTHHGAFDISFLNFIPHIVLMAPRDTTEFRQMLHFMADYDAGPSAIRYPRGSAPESLPEARLPIQLGRAEILKPGRIWLVAIGSMVGTAYEAALQLSKEGLDAGVVNARFIKPLDEALLLGMAKDAELIVTLEENSRRGGFGEGLRDLLCSNGFSGVPFEIVSLPDHFVEHGAQPLIRAEAGLDVNTVCNLVRERVGSQVHRRGTR